MHTWFGILYIVGISLVPNSTCHLKKYSVQVSRDHFVDMGLQQHFSPLHLRFRHTMSHLLLCPLSVCESTDRDIEVSVF